MKTRDPNAIKARQRKAGPMKHKNAPRGGERQKIKKELKARWQSGPMQESAKL